MPKQVTVTKEQMEWLRQHHLKLTYADMAKEIGCCPDTLKRILMRMGLQSFPGAKYQQRNRPDTWRRPCILCGCKRPRPRYWYRCRPCRRRAGYDKDE